MLSRMDAARDSLRVPRRIRCGTGPVYFVTTVTEGRVAHFRDPVVAAAVCASIRDGACGPGARPLAWVLMPDHWHGLVRLDGDANLAACVATFRSRTARAAREVDERIGELWCAAFHRRVLRRDSELLGATRYLVANPVRAGLATRAGDYPYWHGAAVDAVRPPASPHPTGASVADSTTR